VWIEFTPALSHNGNALKSVKDANTSQKILVESAEIFDASPVSICSHIIARTETSGADARAAPMNEFRFDTSDIRTIKSEVMMSFTKS